MREYLQAEAYGVFLVRQIGLFQKLQCDYKLPSGENGPRS